jgi:hypothetical protein
LTAEYGFEPLIIDAVEDHRLIMLAQDAMKYRQGLKAGAEAVKKVVNLPKLQKPGAQRINAETEAQKAKFETQRIKLRKSGTTSDLAALLEQRIKV